MIKDSKTVFALRRDSKLDEALELGRELYDAAPADIWVVRAFGWVLCDCAKQALEAGRRDDAASRVEELDALTLGDQETVLARQRDYLRQQASPCGEDLAKAREATKAGNNGAAISLSRDAVKTAPDSQAAQTGLGWAISRELKEEAVKPEPERAKTIALLREYLSLSLVEKPSILHSLILVHATHLQNGLDVLYPSFVRKWGLENLRDEDFQPYRPEGKNETYPSLAEKVGMALGKSLKGLKRTSIPSAIDPVWIAEWLNQMMARFPDQIWIRYHYAKTLLLVGRHESARDSLIPIVRAKQSEFWVWSTLAETFERKTGHRLACLCRALLCKVQDPAFLKGVLRSLPPELEAAGEHDAVKRLALAQGEDYAPARIKELAPVLEKYALAANGLAFENLPWMDAIVSGRIEPKTDVKGAVFVLVKNGSERMEVRVGLRKFRCLEQATVGEPVAVRMVSTENRQQIVDARVRGGVPWDLIPETIGVVKHVNRPKGLVAIALGVDVTTLAHFDRFPESESWAPGAIVAVRCNEIRKDALSYLVAVRRDEGIPANSFFKNYDGVLTMLPNGSSAFVGDVYIQASLIAQQPPVKAVCHGAAILETHPQTGRKGWKALTFFTTT